MSSELFKSKNTGWMLMGDHYAPLRQCKVFEILFTQNSELPGCIGGLMDLPLGHSTASGFPVLL